MPTTVITSIGSRTADSVTVNTVTGTSVTGYSNAWSVVLSASVPSTTKIGDKLTTGANSYLITNIVSATITAVGDAGVTFTSTSTPGTGSATTARAYSSIGGWAGGTSSSLVSKDWVWKGELYKEGGGTNGEWVITSDLTTITTTCDSTRYLWLTTAAGASFKDNASKLTNALRYNTANGVAVSTAVNSLGVFNTLTPNNNQKLVITGIQFDGGGSSYLAYFNNGQIIVDSCIVRYISVPFYGCFSSVNCLFYLPTNASSLVNQFGITTACYLINCHVIGTGATVPAVNIGNYAQTGNIIRNCNFFGFSSIRADANNKLDTTNSTYNVTDLASFGWTATGNLVSKTLANQFQNTGSGTEDFRVKAGADLINAGTRDQTYTNDLDIVGTTRSTSTPTIGAWEYAAAAATPNDTASLNRGIGRGLFRGIA